MLVILNLPLIGMWIKLLQVPYRLLFPSILVFMAIGVYSVNNSPFDLLVMALFGLFGIVCTKLGMEPAPLALGVVLGPLMEENLRRAMLLSRGGPERVPDAADGGLHHRLGPALALGCGAEEEALRGVQRGEP